MAQPPQGDAQPPDVQPDPGPAPIPDPGPPQPGPPPEPAPAPEPPHAAAPPPDDATAILPALDPVGAEETADPTVGQPQADCPPMGANPGEPGHPAQGRPQPSQSQPSPPYPGPAQPDQPWIVSPATAAPRGRRTVLWVSLALLLTLLLCGGGGISAFLLLRNAENGDGAPDPGTAVTRFLTAVYTDQDATAAAALVCREARDQKKISAKVDEIKGYAKQYESPRFRWDDPSVASTNKERALVTVALTMTTGDEKSAKQELTFTVVKKTGWWVCEVAG